MTVSIFGQPLRHRVGNFLPADPRIAWTACGLRFAWDPTFYRYSMRATGADRPSGRCAECFGDGAK